MSSTMIAVKPLSQNPQRVKARMERLHEDERALKRAQKETRWRREKQGKKTHSRFISRFTGARREKWWADIERHLSRGRDVGTIAVMESVPVCVVTEFAHSIELVKQQTSTKEAELKRIHCAFKSKVGAK